jgi:tetratricopeptide (TPR) repeat protein
VGRTWLQTAQTLVETDPARALALAEQALPLIPAEESGLRWLAESLRTESLLELGEIDQALQAFHLAESWRSANPRAEAGRRSDFTAARLLEALGHIEEAEQLFDRVIAEAFEREAYRESFLDILYLFGFHLRQGRKEKAAALCRFANAQLDLFGIGHEQLRTVWTDLMNAARGRSIGREVLQNVRSYMRAHWKQPARTPPMG